MNEKKFDCYYVTIDGSIDGLSTCYSGNKYENYSMAFEMFKILVQAYVLIINTNITLSVIGSNKDNTDMTVLNWIKIDNK